MLSGPMRRSGWLWSKGMPFCAACLFIVFAHAESTVDVHIENYRFAPPEVRIRPGDSVRWINDEKRTSHSMVFPAEGGRESERIFPGERWQRRFDQAGRHAYHCGPHPEMQGVVVVGE